MGMSSTGAMLIASKVKTACDLEIKKCGSKRTDVKKEVIKKWKEKKGFNTLKEAEEYLNNKNHVDMRKADMATIERERRIQSLMDIATAAIDADDRIFLSISDFEMIKSSYK